MASIISLLVILNALIGIQIIIDASPARIYNGNEAEKDQFPWQVSIRSVGESKSVHCGGSIIVEKWVLTAAQCVTDCDNYTLGFGSVFLDKPEVSMVSTVSVVHPNYKSALKNDLALIKLPEKLQFSETIAAVRLPTKAHMTLSFDGCKSRICGWGHISSNSDLQSEHLLWTELHVISNSKCLTAFGSLVSDSVVCAETLRGGNICGSDFGGALVIEENNHWLQIGIASFIQGCETGKTSGYIRVQSFVEWINGEIQK